MKLIQVLKNIFLRDEDNVSLSHNGITVGNHKESIVRDMKQREHEMFGSDRLQQQKLYEKWVVKETWLLKDEAIPLLCGTNPEIESSMDLSKHDELWQHAQHCVDQKLLPVIEIDMEPEKWRVRPQDVYKWAAISRIDIPETLSAIMDFVMSVVKNTESGYSGEELNCANSENLHHPGDDRERILGAALAILAAYPEKCRNNNGQVDVTRIIEILEDKGEFWFSERMPVISGKARYDLINKWLKTVC